MLGTGVPCWAHPMGNFSINHYSGIHIERSSIELRYIIDIAEIPTYQQIQNSGIIAKTGDPTLEPYLTRQADQWGKNLLLQIEGTKVILRPASRTVIFPPGAGGLLTMKIAVTYRGSFSLGHGGIFHLHYVDDNFEGHAGWKEIVVSSGKGVKLSSDQPYQIDRSEQLTNYPMSLLNSPPQNVEADLNCTITEPATRNVAETSLHRGIALHKGLWPTNARSSSAGVVHHLSAPQTPAAVASPSSPEFELTPNKQSTPRNRFTELMTSQRMGLWFLCTAALLAAGLGALHALEPGHGKTIVAAYLVGSRGRMRHAIGLGLLVTAAHTAGVYMLGAIVLYASKYIIPEQIYPWLSIFAGLVIAVLATYLLLRAWTGVEAPEAHDEGVLHTHWYAKRREPIDKEAHLVPSSAVTDTRTVPLRQLLLLGIAGGIIPCPAALVVLLSAVNLHLIGFGFFLIVSFSFGLAAVLIGIGIAMVKARSLLSRWRSDSPILQRWLPLASASAMLVAGLAIAGSALPAIGFSFHLPRLTGSHLASFTTMVGIGLVLGMRHSTDPDHVVAVSTIVSRERSVKYGAIIGAMWGLGHTLTIFVVGAGIILFNLTIPPRLGLSMEFAVAAMLILLGVLNLTGVLHRLTEHFTPPPLRLGHPDTEATVLSVAEQPHTKLPVASRLCNRFGYYHLVRPLVIGLVHGLAGSAAVALLVLSMIHNPRWAIAYLVVFGLGTVVGMMLMTTVMAIPVALSGRASSRYLTVASGLASVCFGLFMVYQLGYVDGLFTAHARWTPE